MWVGPTAVKMAAQMVDSRVVSKDDCWAATRAVLTAVKTAETTGGEKAVLWAGWWALWRAEYLASSWVETMAGTKVVSKADPWADDLAASKAVKKEHLWVASKAGHWAVWTVLPTAALWEKCSAENSAASLVVQKVGTTVARSADKTAAPMAVNSAERLAVY